MCQTLQRVLDRRWLKGGRASPAPGLKGRGPPEQGKHGGRWLCGREHAHIWAEKEAEQMLAEVQGCKPQDLLLVTHLLPLGNTPEGFLNPKRAPLFRVQMGWFIQYLQQAWWTRLVHCLTKWVYNTKLSPNYWLMILSLWVSKSSHVRMEEVVVHTSSLSHLHPVAVADRVHSGNQSQEDCVLRGHRRPSRAQANTRWYGWGIESSW